MDIHTIIGLAGVVSYSTAYALLQLGMLDGNGVRYSAANVLAALLMLVSLTRDFNLAAVIIQVVWIVVGVAGIALRALRRSRWAREVGELDDVNGVGPVMRFDLRPDAAPVGARCTTGMGAGTSGGARSR